MFPSRNRWLVPLIVVALAIAGGVTVLLFNSSYGCHLPAVECVEGGERLLVRNERAEQITVRVTRPGQSDVLTVGPAGEEGFGPYAACDATSLVATGADGAELGRLNGVGCISKTWVFAADGTVSLLDGEVHRP
ncbi:hypothetical protein [Catellatospora sichuanensis]|uniref:hypothetical protein n=1 Tax=Catellatospora sichuanensis TaxID=1969805 RepID=UPI0011835BD7|nr:hypothetical protein [Catellatospora sichuanensis]